jgi:cytochrome c-type biogenesis protein CcmH
VRRRRALAALPLALLALLVSFSGSAGAAAQLPEVNINEIEAEVMCPVCGTLLELAESPQAQREKAFIARLIAEGKTKSEVKDALVAQYGNAVLALPQDSGFELSAYVVPIIAFVVAALALGLGVYRWRQSSGPRDDRPPAGRGPTDAERKRLDEDLGRYDL